MGMYLLIERSSIFTMNRHIMLQFFQPVVDKITKMLGAQIADIEAKHDVGRINVMFHLQSTLIANTM